MTDLILKTQITEYFTRIQTNVILSNAENETDINIYVENLLAKILSKVFNTIIVNANYEEQMNTSSVDLIDQNGKYTFQVTSTTSKKKIIDSLSLYIKKHRYEKFEEFYIVLIGNFKNKLQNSTINEITQKTNGLFNFDYKKHIIDLSDLRKLINAKNSTTLLKDINEILFEQFGDSENNSKILKQLSVKLEALINSQPRFTRELNSENINAISFDYRYLLTSFLGREDELNKLSDFYIEHYKFRWWAIIGRGGMGKNRLGLEFCNNNDIDGGFIDYQEIERIDWHSWQPLKDTLLIVDYVSVNYKLIIQLINKLASRSDLTFKVRIILLERNLDGEWWINFRSSILVRDSCYSEQLNPLVLSGLDDNQLYFIIKQFNGNNTEFNLINKEDIIKDLIIIDPLRRPLFAMFSGLSISLGASIRDWGQKDLLEFLLLRERNHIWEPYDVHNELPIHNNLLIISTIVNGLNNNGLEILFGGNENWLPNKQNFNADLYGVMTGYSLENEEINLMPLLPDILGEYYVLENLKPDRKYTLRDQDKSKKIIDVVWSLNYYNTWFFIRKTIEDFSDHSSLPILFDIINTGEAPVNSFPYIDLGIVVYKLMIEKLKVNDVKSLHVLFECLLIMNKSSKTSKHSIIDLDIWLAKGCLTMIEYYIKERNFNKIQEYYKIVRDNSDRMITIKHIFVDQKLMFEDMLNFEKNGNFKEIVGDEKKYFKNRNTEIFAAEASILTIINKYLFENDLDTQKSQIRKHYERIKFLYEKDPNEIRVILKLMANELYYEVSKSLKQKEHLVYGIVFKNLENYYNMILEVDDKYITNCDRAEILINANYQIFQCLIISQKFEKSKEYFLRMVGIVMGSNSSVAFSCFVQITSQIVSDLRKIGQFSLAEYYKDFLPKPVK